jgi:hypothetical protein
MPEWHLTCAKCGFEGRSGLFTLQHIEEWSNEASPRLLSTTDVFACDGECRGLKLTRKQRKQIEHDLKSWTES